MNNQIKIQNLPTVRSVPNATDTILLSSALSTVLCELTRTIP
jgi:hypothetical protein